MSVHIGHMVAWSPDVNLKISNSGATRTAKAADPYEIVIQKGARAFRVLPLLFRFSSVFRFSFVFRSMFL